MKFWSFYSKKESLATHPAKASMLLRHRILSVLLLGIFSIPSLAAEVSLWSTIPFIRGQDLCQYQDAYGRSRSAARNEMVRDVKDLMAMGAEAKDSAAVIIALDNLIDKQRQTASSGLGMDVTLEGLLKAALDQTYRDINPKSKKVSFFNPNSLMELLTTLKDQQRQGQMERKQFVRISGIAWGTYAFAPSCNNDILLTLHVALHTGETFNFSAKGEVEWTANRIAQMLFNQFQATQFPSDVMLRGKRLTLMGTPGAPVGHAPSSTIAEKSCASIKSRLPTWDEYETLGIMGDWNGGVTLKYDVWALAGNKVLAPNLRNPSPVRDPEEVRGEDIHFYCVR
jgi:hypothetical protein